jgi:hypothetical protein
MENNKNNSDNHIKNESDLYEKPKNEISMTSRLKKAKDFPVKIINTEINNKNLEKNDEFLKDIRNITPKKSDRTNKFRPRSLQKLKKIEKKTNKNIDTIKTTIESKTVCKNKKLKSLKSKTRTNLYNDQQNEDDDNDKESTSRQNDKKLCLTIENSFPKKMENFLLKNKSEYHPGLSDQKNDKTTLTKQNSELTDNFIGLTDDKNKETGIEDNDDNLNIKKYKNKKEYHSKGKNRKKQKAKNNLFCDPLNPYLTNWPSSFLKIGYNVGFHSNEVLDGVPVLRIQKLKQKVVLPPIYKVKYNQFTDNKNYKTNNEDELDIVGNKEGHKLFNNINYKNKSKSGFLNQFNVKDNEKNNENNEVQNDGDKINNIVNSKNEEQNDETFKIINEVEKQKIENEMIEIMDNDKKENKIEIENGMV